MDNDLSRYRLNDDSELDKYRSDAAKFIKFQFQIYNMLDGIAEGESVKVCDVVVPGSVEVFIKVVCLYILMHQNDGIGASKIEFSNDYRKIYRRPGLPEIKPKANHFYSRK